MTNAADLHPDRIPGYHDGPFARRLELLDQRLFWHGHLYSCAQGDAGRLLRGADYGWADHRNFQRRLWERGDWPAFTIPLAAGHRLHVVHRTVAGDAGVDYLLHHPNWDRADPIARDDGHFMGPGLSWTELVAAADHALPGGTTADPHANLLLLLPALGDNAVPEQAVSRLAAALSARLGVKAPQPLAAALLESQGPAGPAQWATVQGGVRINNGRYSFRNPVNEFALADDRLARVSAALSP
ncbi:hypothetical protein [Streptomyces piniterrae]|uniref:hypothetical protein n=1 Tax=Streptomyces piniterrae TaxID=2571125 RepID=UPI001C9E2E00|nr:hypothetical protein [Streptomyces piniterrae]